MAFGVFDKVFVTIDEFDSSGGRIARKIGSSIRIAPCKFFRLAWAQYSCGSRDAK
jgi:hypothetical protein